MIGKLRPVLFVSAGTRRVLLILLVLVLLFIVFLPHRAEMILQGLGQPTADIVALPIEGMAALDRGARNVWNRYLALQGVYDQNRRLLEKIQTLQGEINHLREKAVASDRLALLLDFHDRSPMETLASRIIGRNATNWYQALILDKGKKDGVGIEMGVVTPAGVVGQVVKVASSTSIVLLLTDPNVAVTGLVQRTRDEGIVQGTAEGLVRMKYIPPLSPVKEGDMIVTSGLTGGFPRGLLIGRVKGVEEREGELFQSADIEPVVDFHKLEEVLIITSAKRVQEEGTLPDPSTSLGSPQEEP